MRNKDSYPIPMNGERIKGGYNTVIEPFLVGPNMEWLDNDSMISPISVVR